MPGMHVCVHLFFREAREYTRSETKPKMLLRKRHFHATSIFTRKQNNICFSLHFFLLKVSQFLKDTLI